MTGAQGEVEASSVVRARRGWNKSSKLIPF